MKSRFTPFLFLWLLLASAMFAQVVITSTVVGSVTDQQGAVVPGATVTLVNVDTGVERKGASNNSGEYQFPNLNAGHYKVQVEKEGFAKGISTLIPLENGTTQRVNFALKIGKTEQVVEVTSAAALLNTEDANVSGVIESKFANDLPMQGRNYLNFAQIMPNFNSGTGDNTRMRWGLASATMPGAMQLNVGGTEYGVGYYVDGLNNNDNWVEGPVMNVNQDTIQEVKAEVSDYSAEYGRDVGQIDVTSKSGTNALHGTVYDTLQNSGMNALDPYSKYQGIPRSAYHQNQYGFTVGGPVIIPKVFNGKNKLFFFGSFERLRNRGSAQYTTYVPTEAERTGDFSEWLKRFPVDPAQCDGSSSAPSNCRYVIYDPTTYNATTQTRSPYPNNVITNANATALAYLSHFPSPNGYSSPQVGNFNNYSGTTTSGLNNNNYTMRGDYTFSSKDNVYFRWLHDSGTVINEGGLIPELAMGDGPMHSVNTYQVHYVRAFTPTLTNEFNISWTRGYNHSADPAQAQKFVSTQWIHDLFKNSSTSMAGFTSYDKSLFNITNDGTFGVNFASPGSGASGMQAIGGGLSVGANEFWYQYVPIFQLTDNVMKVFGRHTIKAGFYMSRREERDNDVIRGVNFYGNYTGKGPNVGDGSGNGIADFITGYASDMNQRTPVNSGDASLYFAMPEYSWYVNDSWQATKKLTLSLGVRYDLPIPAYGVNDYYAVVDKTYPGWRLVMPGLTPGTHARPFSADKNDVAPRIGVAYRLDEKTVVRSGYGIFYESGRFKFLDQMFWNSPGYGGAGYYSANDNPQNPGQDPAIPYYTIDSTWPQAQTVDRGTWPVPLGEKAGILYNRMWASTTDEGSWTTPYVQRWSLDIQREIGKAVVGTVGYVGSKGTHLPMQWDLNLPAQGTYLNGDEFYLARPLTAVAPQRWESINTVRNNRNNNYNAMSAELKVRAWHGMTSQVSYTWSKQLDTFFGENGESGTHAIGGQWHPDWSYGPSDADHTHRFVAAVTYALPGRSIQNRMLRELLWNWQVSTIATFESGAPYTIFNGYTSSYDYMGDVPDMTCNPNNGPKTLTQWINTGCFSEPAASTDPSLLAQGITNFAVHRGNESRNSVRGPGINNWDMGLQKAFTVFGEGRQLLVRADAFNVFNHTQWSGLNTYDDRLTNDQSTFGSVTGARPGRNLQLNMRFVF